LNGILPENQNFQGGDSLILFQIGVFSLVEKTHVSVKRKPCVLEGAAYSTLFSCEN
jgi:hypothetical protein